MRLKLVCASGTRAGFIDNKQNALRQRFLCRVQAWLPLGCGCLSRLLTARFAGVYLHLHWLLHWFLYLARAFARLLAVCKQQRFFYPLPPAVPAKACPQPFF